MDVEDADAVALEMIGRRDEQAAGSAPAIRARPVQPSQAVRGRASFRKRAGLRETCMGRGGSCLAEAPRRSGKVLEA